MPRFFVSPNQVESDQIVIEGGDVKHISKVLRMKPGDELTICDGSGYDYECTVDSIEDDAVIAEIRSKCESVSELPVRIYLFQGLPKGDKMELIVQKAVELGVHEIIPVAMSRCIMKLDDKKGKKKIERWQSIAESAAKQAGRGCIPEVKPAMTYGHALQYAEALDGTIVPYENAKGMTGTREIIRGMKDCKSIGIFIGPEGGFADEEIEKALGKGFQPVTLGKRILRTETAGLTALSILMFEFEED